MALDLSGAALGSLIAQALALPTPPVNPTPAQEAIYTAAVAAQLKTWTTVSKVILTYITTNAVVNTNDTVTTNANTAELATVIAPSGGGPCTGTLAANGTGTGTGTIS